MSARRGRSSPPPFCAFSTNVLRQRSCSPGLARKLEPAWHRLRATRSVGDACRQGCPPPTGASLRPMEEFQSKIIQVDGSAVMLDPTDLNGRVSEAKLEELLIANPELAGEPLLVLGSQLAEFAEDKDRLDVLAVDRQGELVLLELKVDGDFRLTDLQALAYAAGYAGLSRATSRTSSAGGLKGWRTGMQRSRGDKDDCRLRRYPRRVRRLAAEQACADKTPCAGLSKAGPHTVKWLGDVFAMPIEAIQVLLFEDAAGRFHFTFERLLPLKSEAAFDLKVKRPRRRSRSLETEEARHPEDAPGARRY